MTNKTNENSFLLVDLKEDKAKKLAQVIGNDSCRKIINFLTKEDEATESKIAKELKLPLSTVHYNLQHLYKAGLVTANEYHYSKKGKEINHYKLANKYIIIAPRNDPNFLDKLKEILPLGIFAAIASGGFYLYEKMILSQPILAKTIPMAQDAAPILQKAVPIIEEKATPMIAKSMEVGVSSGVADGVLYATQPVAEAVTTSISTTTSTISPELYTQPVMEVAKSSPNIALWFFLGAMSVVAFMLIYNFLKKK